MAWTSYQGRGGGGLFNPISEVVRQLAVAAMEEEEEEEEEEKEDLFVM